MTYLVSLVIPPFELSLTPVLLDEIKADHGLDFVAVHSKVFFVSKVHFV